MGVKLFMRVLGIDPGTIRMGMAVLEVKPKGYEAVAFEVMHITKNEALPKRLREIYRAICGFIEIHHPDVLSLENVFFDKNVPSMIKIGEARACAMLAAAEKDIPVAEYPPARVKQAISGNGRASKIQMQQMMRSILGLKAVPPEDAADALAVAMCHIQSQQGTRFYERARRIQQAEKNVRIPVGQDC